MLQKWAVENFKSIKGRIELDFAPITIFAGANSSGKSTILHSILLAKQTLRYAPISRPLALNGPILKLGFYDEIKNSASESDHIGIGCKFDFHRPPKFENIHVPFHDLAEMFTDISIEARFGVTGTDDVARLHPTLRYSSISCVHLPTDPEIDFDPDEEDYEQPPIVRDDLSIVIGAARAHGVWTGARDVGSDPRPLFTVEKIDAETKHEVCEGKVNATVVGARAQHFLPAEILVEYDLNLTRARRSAERLCSLNPPLRLRYETQERVPTEALDYISGYLEQHGFERDGQRPLFPMEETEKSVSLWDAAAYLRETFRQPTPEQGPSRAPRSNLASLRITLQDPELQSHLISLIAGKFGSKSATATETTGGHQATINYLENFLSNRTKYIGPLRDEPKPLYPLEEIADLSDVGYRGEHTAAVLELNRYKWIYYISPQSLTSGQPVSTSYNTLLKAVTEWLEYLGVATAVNTSDMGKFGHQMQVSTDEYSKAHDLTNVGVGVSQVLPIVVMALLAPTESLLIFEQPELHLHPLVQSRLADFFISLSLLDKQCIIETHSEYLIQRFRRRIAEDESDDLRNDIQAYFVERKGGASAYQSVHFTEFGAIADWPADFFDQADKEVEQILTAASKKRIRKRKSQK